MADLQNQQMFGAKRTLNIRYPNPLFIAKKIEAQKKQWFDFFVYSWIEITFSNFSMYKTLSDLKLWNLLLLDLVLNSWVVSEYIKITMPLNSITTSIQYPHLHTPLPTYPLIHTHNPQTFFSGCCSFVDALDLPLCKWKKAPHKFLLSFI